MLKDLVKLADELDAKGHTDLAQKVDEVIKEVSGNTRIAAPIPPNQTTQAKVWHDAAQAALPHLRAAQQLFQKQNIIQNDLWTAVQNIEQTMTQLSQKYNLSGKPVAPKAPPKWVEERPGDNPAWVDDDEPGARPR